MHWIHLPYQTPHLAAQPTVEYWLFPSWSRGWLGATACCLCPASQDSIIFHSTGSGKVPNSTSEVGFLLCAYCFHTIVKWKKKIIKWSLQKSEISPSWRQQPHSYPSLLASQTEACERPGMLVHCSVLANANVPSVLAVLGRGSHFRGRHGDTERFTAFTPTIPSGLGHPS